MSKRVETRPVVAQLLTSTSDGAPPLAPRSSRPTGDDEERRRKRRRAHRDGHISSGRHSSHHRHHRQEPSPDAETALVRYGGPKTKIATNQDTALFVIDKRGDPLILRYGTVDRSRVPEYRRYRSRRVLGVAGPVTISPTGTREEFAIGGPQDGGGSVFRERHPLLLKTAHRKGRRVRPDPTAKDDKDWHTVQDFISLTSSSKKKHDHSGASDASNSSDHEGPSYRSIHGMRKEHHSSDSDSEDGSGSSVASGTAANAEPSPAKDDLFGTADDHEGRTRDETTSLADLRLSMLETALSHAKAVVDRERVLLRLMREGSRIWARKQVAKRWQDVSMENINSFALWKARLDFEMTDTTTFTFDRLKSFHRERLHFLRAQLLEAKSTSASSLMLLSLEIIYVFLRTTRFIYDAGFAELAVAAWQAQLEMTFARPRQLAQAAHGVIIASLKDFWESEVIRIGEEGARGWRHYTDTAEMDDPPEARQEQTPKPPKTRDAYKAWALDERDRASRSTLAARTLDDGSDDDPFRVVMFTDIEDLLFYLPTQALPDIQPHFIDAFLLFCRLPPAFGRTEWVQSAQSDPFVAGGREVWDRGFPARAAEEGARKLPQFRQDGGRFAISSEVLLSGPEWFRYLPAIGHESNDESRAAMSSFASIAVGQLARVFGVEDVAEYSLAMEWLKEPGSVKKVAKGLLKLYSSNLSLYNAYALAERTNGNREVAQRVLLSATSQNLGPNLEFASLPWHTWAILELEVGHKDRAISRLCSSVEERPGSATLEEIPMSPLRLLKARQKLSTSRDYQLSSGNLDGSAMMAQSCTLLEYLTAEEPREPISERQGNITAAMSSVQYFSDEICSRGRGKSIAHEQFLQSAARLLYFHASHGPYRPVYLREQLLKFVHLFPQNTMFLGLLAWADPSLRIDDPIRRILRTTVLAGPHDCVSSRLFAVRRELQAGNVFSARAAFEHAVESEACSGSADLWVAYVRFCRETKELRPKAKDVFYRAVYACPWSKELIMEAFMTVAKDMESSELRAVYNTIQARGLRVHVDLDEFLEKWHRAQKVRRK